ncbi:MAG: hypothetical protein WAP03_27945, partial [Methylorubrum rhodinum]|uniref:hypothetical protein n=1 Tax=Methylorubrum rhodinum TaxID=29428 RepID=UPI003BB0338F
FANITDSEACNNLCIDNWASRDVDPVQFPGNGPSLHRGGIVLDCDTTKLNPTVARILLSGNICKNTQPAATQQNGLQIRNPATMDFSTINIDSSNQFGGNSNEDITPPYWYSGRKARSNRAYVAPAYAASGATDFDPARAGLREIAEQVAYLKTLFAAQGAVGEVPFPLPGATLDMDFARGQYLGKQPSDLTVARTSTTTGLLPKDVSAESFMSFAANTLPLVPGRGAVIMPARTQYLANPAAPATQTVTLAAGTYTCWCIGTGWLALSQGTGVATEVGGGVIVRPGTPQTLTVTTAGTFMVAVNGLLRFVQIENTAEPSVFIPTTGASAGTVASLGGTAFTDIFGSVTTGVFYADVIPTAPVPAAATQFLFGLCDGTATNRIVAFRQSNGEVQFRYTSAGTTTALGSNLVVPPGQSCRIALSFGVGANALRNVINGNIAYFASPAAAPVGLNTLRLGVNEAATGQQGAMILRRIAFVPGVIPEHIARTYAAGA